MRARRGMAMLLITHDLGVVAEVCDRVLVMYAGRWSRRGRVEEIFLRPRHPYTRGFSTPFRGRHRQRGARLTRSGTVPSP
jgi:ABC-type dipeptide/oligopeptide/nickel transport system ATPase component